MSKLDVAVIRIDPFRKNYTKVIITGRDFAQPMRRLTRAKQLGHRKLIDIEEKRIIGQRQGPKGIETFDAGPTMLCVAADAQAGKGMPGWRVRGGETTVGYSVLFGAGPNGTLTVPVDLDWLEKHLVWVEADEADAESEDEA
ncbi:MAG: hypothetical protein ABW128_06970 [Rhizorhabdus sp.]